MRHITFARVGLKPLSGNVCLRPHHHSLEEAIRAAVSNPSRGTCAFGRVSLGGRRVVVVRLKPLSGNVCLRPLKALNEALIEAGSQTPLGERVPSA